MKDLPFQPANMLAYVQFPMRTLTFVTIMVASPAWLRRLWRPPMPPKPTRRRSSLTMLLLPMLPLAGIPTSIIPSGLLLVSLIPIPLAVPTLLAWRRSTVTSLPLALTLAVLVVRGRTVGLVWWGRVLVGAAAVGWLLAGRIVLAGWVVLPLALGRAVLASGRWVLLARALRVLVVALLWRCAVTALLASWGRILLKSS